VFLAARDRDGFRTSGVYRAGLIRPTKDVYPEWPNVILLMIFILLSFYASVGTGALLWHLIRWAWRLRVPVEAGAAVGLAAGRG
jgi:hypothetical protein